MKLRPVPTALFAAGALAATSGAALGAKGASDQLEARKRENLAGQRYLARRALTDGRRSGVNERLADYAELQRRCQADVVRRMISFLRRHAKQVRESEHGLVDHVEAPFASMPAPKDRDLDVEGWAVTAVAAAGATAGTATVIAKAVDRYGVASTGRAIANLSGAARDKAARAFLGGGSIKSGGGGIALGNQARATAAAGPAVLVAGTAAKIKGTRALTHADRYEAEVAVACADLDLFDVHLRVVDQRVDELTDVLTKLRTQALNALDELEAVEFDSHLHAEEFQKAMTLVKAVQDVRTTPLISSEGQLADSSASLIVKYRPMIEEHDD